MTTTNIDKLQQGKELTGKDQVKDLLEQNKQFIAQALPRHMNAERLLRTAITAYTTTPALKECYVPSLIGGIVQCAIMGLEPNTPLGHAYMIPFNNTKKHRKEVQVIFGYAGLIELMRRSGNLIDINAKEVRAGDVFEFEYGLNQKLRHIPSGNMAGEISHFYAYANLKDGGQQYVVMTKAEVDARMKKSQSKGEYGPWKDYYVAMGKKTAIRELSKYMPKSIELSTAVAMDEYADLNRGQNLESALTDDYTIEGEVEDDDAAAEVDPFDAGYGHKKDKTGDIWNPDLHAQTKENGPIWNQDGSFRKKPGKQAETAPEEERSDTPPVPDADEPTVDRSNTAEVSFGDFQSLLDKAVPEDKDTCEDIINSLNPAVQELARKKFNEKFPVME